jgi:plastocyanin
MFKLSPLAAAITAALALSACGSSGSSSSSSSSAAPSSSTTSAAATSSASAGASAGGAGAVSIAADPSGKLAFTKKTLTAKAGTVTIDFTNKAPLNHNFTLQKGTNGAVVGATPTFDGGSKTLSVKLTPGTYTYFCTIPGHRMAGMQGTLTVQ